MDVNAPAAISGTPGALRLLGNGAALTFAENVDFTVGAAQLLTLYGGGGNYTQFKTNGEIYTVAASGASNMTIGNATNGISMNSVKSTTSTFGGSVTFNVYNSSAALLRQMILQDDGLYQTLGATTVKQPIIQTGTGSITTTLTPVNISFSPAYTVAPVIQITGIGSTSTAYTYNVANVTTSGFRVNSTNAIGGTSFYWTAFGN